MTSHATVFIPGMASVGSTVYESLVSELKSTGAEEKDLIVVDLPSVDTMATKASIKPNALEADTEFIRAILRRLVEDEGRDVVIVGHSYGGTPSLYASDGLWKHLRSSQGQRGGVVRAALISSSLSLPGESIAVVRGQWLADNGLPPDGGAMVESVDGESFLIPTGFEHVFMNDIENPPVDKLLKPAAMSIVTSSTSTQVDPKNWKISYLVLTEIDLAMPEGFQRFLIKRAQEVGVEIEVAEMRSGHFPQLSHVKEVAAWLKRVVR